MKGPDTYKELSLIIAEKQKVIDQLTKEKFSLLKTISHDIRSPFNQLFALLQLMELETDNMNADIKAYIDKMYHSVIGGMEMIKNLHDLRALDQGSITLTPSPFRLKRTVEQVVRSFHIQARLKSVKLELMPVPEELEINNDNILLKKILENIISNAIKYPEAGSAVFIEVTTDRKYIIFTIRDQGPGIPEKEMDQAFNKFKKLSPLPSGGENTTGLGLYLAHRFAVMAGGNIKIENHKEGGLEVRVILPVFIDHSE